MVNALLDKSAAMLIRQRNLLLIPLISDDRGVLAKQDFFWPLAKVPSSHMVGRGQEGGERQTVCVRERNREGRRRERERGGEGRERE